MILRQIFVQKVPLMRLGLPLSTSDYYWAANKQKSANNWDGWKIERNLADRRLNFLKHRELFQEILLLSAMRKKGQIICCHRSAIVKKR